jgi:hypothetical protein
MNEGLIGDVHRSVQVLVEGRWQFVDPTHHAPLLALGLTVADWDGASSTDPAYLPRGPLLVEDVDDELIHAALAEVRAWFESCPPASLRRWRDAHIACL